MIPFLELDFGFGVLSTMTIVDLRTLGDGLDGFLRRDGAALQAFRICIGKGPRPPAWAVILWACGPGRHRSVIVATLEFEDEDERCL